MNNIKRGYGDLRILVADDGVFTRNIVRLFLEKLGAPNVVLAAGGHEALAILRSDAQAIDIMFCDLQMPDMDGVEVVRHAATLPKLPAFVFVSAAHAAMLRAAADLAGSRGIDVLGTMCKPVTREAIIKILDRYLDKAAVDAPELVDPDAEFIPTKSDIEAGLNGEQFELYFQPKYELPGEKIAGFESLIRWWHPDDGLILPGRFIAVAERSGLIGRLTHWAVDAALRTSAAWNAEGLFAKISINLSSHVLVDLTFPDRITGRALRAGVDPKQIILEVTESGAFSNVANTLDVLARLHLKGFILSIDDFGGGSSSIEQISRVPFLEMKIDRAFVRGCALNQRLRAIIGSSVSLAGIMGLKVVAKGVETAEDLAAVGELRVDMAQGFYLGMPMTSADAFAWAVARKCA